MKRYGICLLLFLCTSLGFSTAPTKFRIIFSKGSSQYSLKPSPYQWKKIYSDSLAFPANCFIKLDKGAEITLLGNNKIYYQLNKEGTYKLSLLKAPDNSSVLIQYGKYLWAALFHNEHPDLDKNRLEYMKAKGGGPRGKLCPLYAPADGYLSGDSILFVWKNSSATKQEFVIYSDSYAQDELFSKVLADSFYVLPVNRIPLKSGEKYFWTIKDAGDYQDCTMKNFVWIDAAQAKTIEEQANQLKSSLSFTEGINCLMMAYFYAEKGWCNQALYFFNQAILLEPDSPAIKNSKPFFDKIAME